MWPAEMALGNGRYLVLQGTSQTSFLSSRESNVPFILVSQNTANKECDDFWFPEYAKCPSVILNHISVFLK